jgi:hypothetical protein
VYLVELRIIESYAEFDRDPLRKGCKGNTSHDSLVYVHEEANPSKCLKSVL